MTQLQPAELFADARRRLADAPREALGEQVSPGRMLGFARRPRIRPRGTAWHLGALLLTDDAVLATGDIVRAREQVLRGFPAESQRRRAELAAAARRGGFAEGQIVHVGWQRIDLEHISNAGELLAVRDGALSIRWSAAGGYAPLERYLDEQVELLVHPPEGAS